MQILIWDPSNPIINWVETHNEIMDDELSSEVTASKNIANIV